MAEPQCSYILQSGHRAGQQCRRMGPYVENTFGYLTLCDDHRQSMLGHLRRALLSGDPGVREVVGDWLESDEAERMRVNERLAALRRSERKRYRQEIMAGASVVYFVEREGFVKIGVTANLPKRLQALSKGSCMLDGMTVGPVTLLATLPGDESNERGLHSLFAAKRVGGEWFTLDDELGAFISGLKGCVMPALQQSAPSCRALEAAA